MTTVCQAFHKEMKIQEALLVDERVKTVLRHFHLGGCHNPFLPPSATIGDACNQQGAPVDKVLKALNDLPHAPATPRCGEMAR